MKLHFQLKPFRITVDPVKPAFDFILCGSSAGSDKVQTAFIATLGSLKAVLLIISVFLSLAVRKQPSEFNESKTIAYAIYNQAFCMICLLAIWQAIPESNYELKYILRSFIILWGTTISLLVIFGRKIYYIIIGKNKAFHTARKSRSMGTSSRGEEKAHSSDSTPDLKLKSIQRDLVSTNV